MSVLSLNDSFVAGTLAPVFGELQTGSQSLFLARKYEPGAFTSGGDDYVYDSWALGLHQAAAGDVPTLRIFYLNADSDVVAHMDVTAGAPVLHAGLETPGPSAPILYFSDPAPNGFLALWTTPTSGTVTSYTLEISTNQSDWTVLSSNATSPYRVTGLNPLTAYWVRVTPYDGTRAGTPALGNAPTTGASSYDVFLVSGQSNAVGYGADGDYYTDFSTLLDGTPVTGLKQWGRFGSSADQIVDAVEPLQHNDSSCDPSYYATPSSSTPRQVGFGLAFAKAYKNATGRDVLLVPCAKGAQPISAFAKGGALYTDMVTRTQAAVASQPSNTLKGVLWLQGESDAENGTNVGAFSSSLNSLIADLRADLVAPTLPFIIGELIPAWVADNTVRPPKGIAAAKAAINSALQTIAGSSNCAWVSAQAIGSDPVLTPNNATEDRYIVHYSAASQRRLGARYYSSYALLVSGGGSGGVTVPTALFKTGVSGSSIVDTAGGRSITLQGMTASSGTDHTGSSKLMLTSSGSGYASVSGDLPAGSFTKTCWVKFSSTPALYTNIMSGSKNGLNYDSGFHHYLWTYTGNKLTATVEPDISGYDHGVQSIEPAIDTWYHLAAVWDDSSSTVTLYVNGAAADSAVLTGITNPGYLAANGRTEDSLFLGSYYNAAGTFAGQLDDVRLYGSALSAAQVRALYNGI